MSRGEVFSHQLLLYSSTEAFVETAARFIRDGVEAGEPVVVVLPEEKRVALEEELRDVAERVVFGSSEETYVVPPRTYASYYKTISELTDGGRRPMRGMGEPPWHLFSTHEMREMKRAEAAVNRYFVGLRAKLVCPYSTSLPDEILSDALRTHPYVLGDGTGVENDRFAEPVDFAGGLDAVVPAGAETLPELEFRGSRTEVHDFIEQTAEDAGVEAALAGRLMFAANEVISNALRSEAEVDRVRCGLDDDAFVCEIDGRGGPFDDPLAGYRHPSDAGGAGLDLWLARQTADRMRLVSLASGASLRLEVVLGL